MGSPSVTSSMVSNHVPSTCCPHPRQNRSGGCGRFLTTTRSTRDPRHYIGFCIEPNQAFLPLLAAVRHENQQQPMDTSTLKPCSYDRYTETRSSQHRWLLGVFLAVFVTNQPRASQGHHGPPGPPCNVSTGSLQGVMHDGSLLTACSAFLAANKWPELRSSAVPGCQLCSAPLWVHQGHGFKCACAASLASELGASLVLIKKKKKKASKQANKQTPTNNNKKTPFYSKMKEACG